MPKIEDLISDKLKDLNIVSVFWFTPRGSKIFGVVIIKTLEGTKGYIKQVNGLDLNTDIRDIAENGAKILPMHVKILKVIDI